MSDQEDTTKTFELPERLVKHKFKIIGSLVTMVALTLLFLPSIQTITYHLLVASPSTVQWSLVAILLFFVGVYRENKAIVVGAVLFFILFGLILGPFVGNIQAHEEQADRLESKSTLQVDSLPETTEENIRVVPRGVADTYADSSMQLSQYGLTESDIAYQDEKYQWSYGVKPDNLFVSFQEKQYGSLYVNMEQTQKETELKQNEFTNGRGQLWFDSYRYQSVLNNPTALHVWDSTFNTESYIAHSTLSHDWEFRILPLPQFYAIPQHNSVEVMDTDGNVDSLTPSEAQQSQKLQKQNFYPYGLSMFKVNSMKYKNGVINLWTSKKEVFEIAGLPSSSNNNWPLTVPTQKGDSFGLTYFVGAEAVNSGTGLYQVWTIDGQTGNVQYIQYDQNQLGPSRAIEYVQNKEQVNELKDSEVVSPIPIVSDGQLYWHVKVVPSSETGILYTGFVNAKSGDVTLLERTEPIYKFMNQKEVQQVKQSQDTTKTTTTTTVTVAVTDESGEIIRTEEINVPKGGTTDITVKNNSTD